MDLGGPMLSSPRPDDERLGLVAELRDAAERVSRAVAAGDELELVRALTAADRARVALLTSVPA